MESIHILQKYVESRMQTAYHSAAPEQCLRGRSLGRGKRWLWMCVGGRLGALTHENTMHALTKWRSSGYQRSLKEHSIDTLAAITMYTLHIKIRCMISSNPCSLCLTPDSKFPPYYTFSSRSKIPPICSSSTSEWHLSHQQIEGRIDRHWLTS